MSDSLVDETPEIIDAELVTNDKTEVSGGEILINIEGLIKNHISSNNRLADELKKLKEMLDDIFANDPTYQKHLEESKELNKIKNTTKAEILKRPQAADLSAKIKAIKSQIKENQNALSDYLQEYARLSGLNEIEGEDGEIREIVYIAKLVKKGQR